MNTMDTLLIRHGIDPTLVNDSNKERLRDWLTEAKTNAISSFLKYAEQIKKDTCLVCSQLLEHTDRLSQMIKQAKATVETLLGDFPQRALLFSNAIDNHALTLGHLKMLGQIETLKKRASDLAAALVEPRGTDNAFRMLSAHTTEISLRHIALCESGRHEALCHLYGGLAAKLPLLCDTADGIQSDLTKNCNAFYEHLSYLAKSTSDTVTALNRSQATQSDYFNLLQSILLELHALSETAGHIQKEVSHVQISDGL